MLCRIDLNEQNRAILHLLLSRIDAPLPEKLDRAVTQAMANLYDIIRDVDLRQDKVLSEAHPQPPIGSKNDYWSSLQRPVPGPVRGLETPRTPAPSAQADPSPFDRPSRAEPRAAATSAAASPQPGTLSVPGIEERDYGKKSAASAQPGPAAAGKPEQKAETLTMKSELGRSGPAVGAVPAAGGRPNQSLAIDFFSERSLSGSTAALGPDQPQGFTIRFNKERTELSSLLSLLETAPPTADAVAPIVEQPREEDRPAPIRRKPDRKRKLSPWWGGIFFALLVGLLVFVIWDRPAPAGTGIPAAAPPAMAPPPPPPSSSPLALAPGPKAPDLRHQTDGLYWYPRSGESIWTLFSFLKAQPASTIGPWPEFLVRILSNNPGLQQVDLIFPKVPLRVSAPGPSSDFPNIP